MMSRASTSMLRSGRQDFGTDRFERLAWLIAGGLVAGIFGVWLVGLGLHAQLEERLPERASTELIRSDATRPAAMRMMQFTPQGTNDLLLRTAGDGGQGRMLRFERDGFIVSIVRSLDRDRRRFGVPLDAPYRLIRWDNGQLLFEDPETGTQIELSAFGANNVAAFAALLETTESASLK